MSQGPGDGSSSHEGGGHLPDVEELKKQANDLFRDGKFEKALTLYHDAILQAPENCALLLNAAQTLLKMHECPGHTALHRSRGLLRAWEHCNNVLRLIGGLSTEEQVARGAPKDAVVKAHFRRARALVIGYGLISTSKDALSKEVLGWAAERLTSLVAVRESIAVCQKADVSLDSLATDFAKLSVFQSAKPLVAIQIEPSTVHGFGVFFRGIKQLPAGTIVLKEKPALYLRDTSRMDYTKRFTAAMEELRRMSTSGDADTLRKFCGIRSLYYDPVDLDKVCEKSGKKLQDMSEQEREDVVLCSIYHHNAMKLSEVDFRLGEADSVDPESVGIFVDASRFNHDCHPNAMQRYDSDSGQLIVVALRDIDPGDELMISYTSILSSTEEKKAHLKFACNCTFCTEDGALIEQVICPACGVTVVPAVSQQRDKAPQGEKDPVHEALKQEVRLACEAANNAKLAQPTEGNTTLTADQASTEKPQLEGGGAATAPAASPCAEPNSGAPPTEPPTEPPIGLRPDRTEIRKDLIEHARSVNELTGACCPLCFVPLPIKHYIGTIDQKVEEANQILTAKDRPSPPERLRALRILMGVLDGAVFLGPHHYKRFQLMLEVLTASVGCQVTSEISGELVTISQSAATVADRLCPLHWPLVTGLLMHSVYQTGRHLASQNSEASLSTIPGDLATLVCRAYEDHYVLYGDDVASFFRRYRGELSVIGVTRLEDFDRVLAAAQDAERQAAQEQTNEPAKEGAKN